MGIAQATYNYSSIHRQTVRQYSTSLVPPCLLIFFVPLGSAPLPGVVLILCAEFIGRNWHFLLGAHFELPLAHFRVEGIYKGNRFSAVPPIE